MSQLQVSQVVDISEIPKSVAVVRAGKYQPIYDKAKALPPGKAFCLKPGGDVQADKLYTAIRAKIVALGGKLAKRGADVWVYRPLDKDAA